MEKAIILKLYTGDISSKAYSACVLMDRFFFPQHKRGCQHYSMAFWQHYPLWDMCKSVVSFPRNNAIHTKSMLKKKYVGLTVTNL